jgi:hypothetical protein
MSLHNCWGLEVKEPRRFRRTLVLLLLLGAAGYLSRRYANDLPLPIRKRTGDALWASCIYMLIAMVRPSWSTLKVAAVALVISYSIEFSQIYHRPWIDRIRATVLGRLILGTTFFWLDQLAYTIGIAAVIPLDFRLNRRNRSSKEQPQRPA